MSWTAQLWTKLLDSVRHTSHYDWKETAMVTRVGILGASGYAALELIKILLRHPQLPR